MATVVDARLGNGAMHMCGEHGDHQVHLGVGAAGFGSVVVGLYGMWHQRGWGEGGTSRLASSTAVATRRRK